MEVVLQICCGGITALINKEPLNVRALVGNLEDCLKEGAGGQMAHIERFQLTALDRIGIPVAQKPGLPKDYAGGPTVLRIEYN